MTRGGTDGELPLIEEPLSVEPRNARVLSRQFFDRLAVLEEGTHEYQYVRNTLIELNLSLVRYAASRYRNRGDDREDVVQVGTIGLIKAIDRFDLSREVEFTTFAVPYIVGEIKRFFRDTSWAVHVPRRLQEARIELVKATEELSSRLDREPTVAELAELMSLPEEEVREARKAANAYTSASLDTTLLTGSGDENEAVLADFIGVEDAGYERVEDFNSLAPLIGELSQRDREIVHMRFVEELTQAQIGERIGVSQMQVSRLLNRILKRLRAGLLPEAA
ncbi:RNA polymerase sigma factor [Streptomyces longispororuber]|uniref:RNA polymerase sigma factor n=1 Tax=Streptomyces longispororuber TaxID=68230 RepID=A0A919AB17_9ACTN|nr:RNA polymerase sigma factor SigF [Streptomyces longispororuber]GHE95261.1 RNA polymerase sigma factor [Streptomyces longispororuber]